MNIGGQSKHEVLLLLIAIIRWPLIVWELKNSKLTMPPIILLKKLSVHVLGRLLFQHQMVAGPKYLHFDDFQFHKIKCFVCFVSF